MGDRWAERTWRPYGAREPYYAVCNEEAFRRASLDADAKARFFRTGAEHAAWARGLIATHVDANFRPASVLDFGCGVGRVLLPLAEGARRAVGCDVSPEMLAEARANAAALGAAHVELVESDDALSRVRGPFDLVHSFITFQHIPPGRGERILAALLARVAPGGVAALHFTYARRASVARKLVHGARRASRLADALVLRARGMPADQPFFPMYEYSLERLFEAARAHGAADVHAALTDHGGHRGAMLVFRVGGAAAGRP
jgi:SAM-dependent methyltransferase